MEMIIKQKANKFYLYFNEIDPANLCFVGYSIMAAQARARKLLKSHNEKEDSIKYIISEEN